MSMYRGEKRLTKLRHFNVAELMGAGFDGFIPFGSIHQQYSQGDDGIPTSPGVYVVIRLSTAPPSFLTKGFGGTHKAKKANVPVAELAAKWVPGASVVYIGKASQRKKLDGLWGRISEYEKAGHRGQTHGHSGGERIWQLADARDLRVAWKVVPGNTEKSLETAMILAFMDKYGRIPFGNREAK